MTNTHSNIINETLLKLLDRQTLSCEESKAAMNEIMSGNVSPVKLAAWLTALRMKGETSSEIAGGASVMREKSLKVFCADPEAVDTCGTGGDGQHTINVSTTAAFIAAGSGITIAKHGNRAVSSKSGSADVFAALGIRIEMSQEEMAECLSRAGIAFLFAPGLHPAMKHAMPVRKELGIRTIFNILGPLTNPAGAARGVIGVYSKHLCRLVAEAGIMLGMKKLIVVHGSDGLDELTVTGPSFVCEACTDRIHEYILSPEELGIPLAVHEDIKGGSPAENAEILKDIVAGRERGHRRRICVLNAAAAILAADKASGWNEAIRRAEESIDTGAATEKLRLLTKLSGGLV